MLNAPPLFPWVLFSVLEGSRGFGRTTLAFAVRRWFGIKASRETGDVVLSVVSARLLITASASHINVHSASSFTWLPFFSKRAKRTLPMVLIRLSHTPPMWLAVGALKFNSIQSQFIFRVGRTWSGLDPFHWELLMILVLPRWRLNLDLLEVGVWGHAYRGIVAMRLEMSRFPM